MAKNQTSSVSVLFLFSAEVEKLRSEQSKVRAHSLVVLAKRQASARMVELNLRHSAGPQPRWQSPRCASVPSACRHSTRQKMSAELTRETEFQRPGK